MKNIKELRESLIDNYTRLKEGTLDGTITSEFKAATKELTNITGKVMASLSLELKNQQHQGTKRSIKFLEYED